MKTRVLCLVLLSFLFAETGFASDFIRIPEQQPPQNSQLDDLEEIVQLWRMSDLDADYYLSSGALSDTFAVHYRPAAACSILVAEAMFYTGGNIQAFVWDYSADAEGAYPNGEAPLRGTSFISPIGETLFGPFNISVDGTGDWETLFDEDDLFGGGIWNPDGDDFMVGFVKSQNDGLPQPLADDIWQRGTSFTWFGGPWMDGYDYPWGGYSSSSHIVDVMMRVGVSYPLGQPPVIAEVAQLPNTTKQDKPCTFSARVTDDEEVGSVYLKLQRNDSTPFAIEMLDPDEDNVYEVTHTLNADFGDTFTYWIIAQDNNGNSSSSYWNRWSFDVVEVETRPVLLIDDRASYFNSLFEVLELMGLWQGYASWDAGDGIDKYLLDRGWQLVIVLGNGGTTIPTRNYDNNAYIDYLQHGGNLLFMDQDYMTANGEPDTPSFATGDFAYDFLGISSAIVDLADEETQFYGVTGTFTEPFATDPFELYYQGSSLHYDTVLPRTGSEVIFTSVSAGDECGIAFDRPDGGKTAYLAFQAGRSMASPANYQQMADLITGMLDYTGPLWIDLVPWKTEIGSEGGGLIFSAWGANLLSDDLGNMDFWTRITMPDGQIVEPFFFNNVYVDGFWQAVFGEKHRYVPAAAPAGEYTFSMCAGQFPTADVSDSFTFTKTGQTGDGNLPFSAWFAPDAPLTADVAETSSSLPADYALSDAWPNPFNSSTSVTLSLPETAEVKVTAFNVMGQNVATLASGRMNAGAHTLTFDAHELASGVYFIRAEIPGQLNELRKVMLVR
ncbi:T9SS type A sorting domain-containing protein [bacterium]|nr:T9SS type A sorting domain-containing protein [bacterium]